jgi:hypothetical protein
VESGTLPEGYERGRKEGLLHAYYFAKGYGGDHVDFGVLSKRIKGQDNLS